MSKSFYVEHFWEAILFVKEKKQTQLSVYNSEMQGSLAVYMESTAIVAQ